MGYNVENFRRIRAEYAQKYKRAEAEANERRAELWEKIEGLREIDRILSATSVRLLSVIIGKSGESFERVKEDAQALSAERDRLLLANGYPTDYSDPKYECDICHDSGYHNGEMCECMRRALVMAGYESSGLGQLMLKQDFSTFSLEYYRSNPRTYDNMCYVYNTLREYASTFEPSRATNILLMGGTGLGKTHLSTAVAKELITRGFDVVYTDAIGMVADFEHARFGNAAGNESGNETGRYFDCDLLIIDDLGAEVNNQFTISCIYNVLNTRINLNIPTIISTNLNQKDLNARYWERITSRILGEFQPLVFSGSDVRKQKLLN